MIQAAAKSLTLSRNLLMMDKLAFAARRPAAWRVNRLEGELASMRSLPDWCPLVQW